MLVRVLSCLLTAALLLPLGGCGDETSAGGEVAGGSERIADDLPAPEAGHQWISWHDVAVQVPAAWVYGGEPSTDWCVLDRDDDPARRNPYYTLQPGLGGVLDIGCMGHGEKHPEVFGPAPERLWVTHVALEPADGGPDIAITDGDWTTTTRTLGDVRIRLLTDDSSSSLIDPILDSARRFRVDQNGCEPTSPAQRVAFQRPPPIDVTTIRHANSISICQYSRGPDKTAPALMGSRRLVGVDADALLAGLQSAPAGTGPDRPQNCLPDMNGDSAVSIRIHHDGSTDDVFAYYDWCFGNGTDDGVQHRELTVDTCAPLFKPPVVLWTFSSDLRSLCNPEAGRR